MANSKISALTSATTPLAGTETVPIVQSGATVKTTVADITGGGGYPGSFTSLTATGNTILGNASTDTVRIYGYVRTGGNAPNANIGLRVGNTVTGSVSGFGIYSNAAADSGTTTAYYSFYAIPQTEAAAFTLTNAYGYYAVNATKGASSTITNLYGVYVADQTQGTNNYGITSAVSSGTDKWNIYASGTAANYFAGNLGIGVTAPAVKLDVLGTVQAAAVATQDAVRLAGRAGGTGTFAVTLTPTTLTASQTLTLPDATTTVVGTDATQTLTNKRIDPRVVSAASASSLTPSIATADIYAYTALAAGLTINAPTGTPVDGDKLTFRLLDNGTARALTWNATYTVIGVTLPTTTVVNKTTYVGCIYNANNTRWDVIAVTTQA